MMIGSLDVLALSGLFVLHLMLMEDMYWLNKLIVGRL